MPDHILALLKKYEAHRVPALIELVDRRTIALIHRGFTEMWQVPLAIYWPMGDPDEESSWVADDSGRIVVSPSGEAKCPSESGVSRHAWRGCLCRPACDQSDLRYACLTAQRRKPLVYYCGRGFFYLTMPVVLEGSVIAVLFTGQLFPAVNTSWVHVPIEGIDSPDGKGVADLHKVSLQQWSATQIPESRGEPQPEEYPQTRPEDLARYIQGLSEARDALLEVASAKAEAEKSHLRTYFRTWLFDVPLDRSAFWELLEEWFTAWRFPYGAFFLGLTYDRDPRRVNVEQVVGLPDVKCGAYEVADPQQWDRLRQAGTTASSDNTFKVAGLLKGVRLPAARVVALPLAKHGVQLYGVRGRPEGPPLWKSDCVSARQFVGDMGLLLDQIEKAKAKEEFLQCFSHELRSPIHAALFTIDRIRKGHFVEPGVLDARCRRLQAQINRLLKVIEGVWQLQTILAGHKSTLNPQRTNLYDFLAHCASQAKDMSQRDDLDIVLERESLPGLPSIEVDPHAFGLVVFNLLDNAVKYSAKHTEVRVRGWREGVEVVLTFENIGLRIPPTTELDVFERFARAKEAIEMVPHSTGIGLFLARHIVAAHGGTIIAASSPLGRNHLVTVSVRLPVKQ